MKSRLCVIGLGNPGAKYKNTRHNIGFDWLDAVLDSSIFSAQSPSFQKKFDSEWWQGNFNEIEVHFLKPQTFMNISGKSLVKWSSKFQGDSQLLVVMDDMDLPLGKIRLRAEGGDGGHRGLRHLIEVYGGKNIPRLRLGVGRPSDDTGDHVLSRFKPDEKEIVNKCLEDAPSVFEDYASHLFDGKFELALNKINGRNYGEIKNGD
jgi:PTH1 family peptidyl-tRNA hydrolase